MKIEYTHKLQPDDARARLCAFADYLQARYGLGVTWNGDSAKVTGKYMVVTIEGTLTMVGDKVSFEGTDPGFLWRNKARDYLLNKLQKYLDPATSVDRLPRA